jgi:arylsulfatase A-like enzyme
VPPGPHRLGFDGEWKAYNFNHLNYSPDAFWHGDTPEPQLYGDGIYESDAQTDFAIDTIRRHAAPDAPPLALFLSWGPPHDPWGPDNVPERHWRLFEGVPFPDPPNYRDANDEPYCDDWARLSAEDRARLPDWRHGYFAQTASIDEAFGRLMAAIDDTNGTRETIVVFTSDHGEMFGAHGRRAKAIFYEEACHVPLMIRWPARIAPRRSEACISAVDLMPTLLGLLGLEIPTDVEGADLSGFATGRSPDTPDAALMQICGATAIWEDGHEWRALRDARYTFAVYRVDGSEHLYDRRADPWQMKNLAADPAHRAVRKDMRRRMQARMDALRDDFAPSSHYRDAWTDGARRILRSATRDFGPQPPAVGAAP